MKNFINVGNQTFFGVGSPSVSALLSGSELSTMLSSDSELSAWSMYLKKHKSLEHIKLK